MAESRTDIVIRPATASDAPALWRLAVLDEARVPSAGPGVLIAEVDGKPVAALAGDQVVADPFVRTASLVELLRLRARQLATVAAPGAAHHQRRRLRLRSHAPVAPHPLPQG
jgi:hypothetical protein